MKLLFACLQPITQDCSTKDDNTAALEIKNACKNALSDCKKAQVITC